MNKAEKLFLDLLSAALWQTPLDMSIYKQLGEEEWKEILFITQKHCVTPMITAKIMELPAEAHPPKSILYPMLIHQKRIEELNEKSSRVLANLSKEFSAAGLPFILLKGLGNAQYYPNPKHRVPGDIDLYFYGDDFQKVYDYTLQHEPEIQIRSSSHYAYSKEEVSVEIHWQISSFFNNKWNMKLIELANLEYQQETKQFFVLLGERIELFPITFNAFYIFMHIFVHFLNGGIGLRQISDWLLFLSKNKNIIDEDKFTNITKEFDLLKAMQLVANCCINNLKAPRDIFPFELAGESNLESEVMQDILLGGNFGNYNPKGSSESNLIGRWNRYSNSIRRTIRFRKIMPFYAFWEPFYRANNRVLISLGIRSESKLKKWE